MSPPKTMGVHSQKVAQEGSSLLPSFPHIEETESTNEGS